MTKIYIEREKERTESTADKEYGDWSISNNIKENSLTLENNGDDFLNIDFDVKEGDKLYLIKGIYNTGDSFGKELGRVEYINIFKAEEEAFDFKRKVEYINEINKKDWYGSTPKRKEKRIKELEFKLDGDYVIRTNWCKTHILKYKGKEYNFPWGGYFEILERIEVIILKVK